jgi:hypothetical protein
VILLFLLEGKNNQKDAQRLSVCACPKGSMKLNLLYGSSHQFADSMREKLA